MKALIKRFDAKQFFVTFAICIIIEFVFDYFLIDRNIAQWSYWLGAVLRTILFSFFFTIFFTPKKL